jgi:transcriptional regulator with XRE-family HTH domain
MAGQTRRASRVLGAQMREVRERRRWSLRELAERLAEVGHPMHHVTVAKIETGVRGVALDEVLALAYALDVSPLHLITPLDDAEAVAVTDTVSAGAVEVRRWLRGQTPLPGQDERTYRTEVPPSEWRPEDAPAVGLGRQAVRAFEAALNAGDEAEIRRASGLLQSVLLGEPFRPSGPFAVPEGAPTLRPGQRDPFDHEYDALMGLAHDDDEDEV